MSLFELMPDSPENPRLGPLQAVIAFSHSVNGMSTAILWCSKELRDDLKESGCQPDDCFQSDKGPGVFVWDGRIHIFKSPATPDGPEEYDAEYQGTLRDLTDKEWLCLRAGTNPLADVPDGVPGIRDDDAQCDGYQPGQPSGLCAGDGHYLCKGCRQFDQKHHEWLT